MQLLFPTLPVPPLSYLLSPSSPPPLASRSYYSHSHLQYLESGTETTYPFHVVVEGLVVLLLLSSGLVALAWSFPIQRSGEGGEAEVEGG